MISSSKSIDATMLRRDRLSWRGKFAIAKVSSRKELQQSLHFNSEANS